MRSLLLLSLLIMAVVTIAADMTDDSKYMYKEISPPVKEYMGDENDFTQSKAPKIVEFYSPYCGGCRKFKPRYMELATEITTLYPIVEFYAVSCVAHKDVCNQHKIRGYPSLFAFPPNKAEGTYLARDPKESGGHGVSNLVQAMGLKKERKLDDEEVEEVEENVHEDLKKLTKQKKEDDDDDDDATGEEEAIERKVEQNAVEHDTEEEEEEKESDETEEEDVATDEEDEPDGDTDEEFEVEAVPDFEAVADSDEDEAASVDSDEGEDEDSNEEEETEEESDATEEESETEEEGWEQAEDETEEEESEHAEDETREEDDDPLYDSDVEEKKPAAGAQQAALKPRDMDQWKSIMAERRKQFAESRANKKILLEKQRAKQVRQQQQQQTFRTVSSQQQGSTKIMLANTPGTSEFERYRQEVLARLQKAQKRGRLGIPKRQDASVQQKVFKKGNLPMVRDIKKQSIVQKGLQKVPVVKRFVKPRPEVALYWDVSHSFVTSMKYSIFTTNEPLSAKKKATLKGWLELVSVSLPPEWALHELVDELYSHVDYISHSEENLKKILDKHPLKRKGWSPSCSKGREGQGYSCGMWKLLHIITLGVAEHRGGNNLVDAGILDIDTTRVFSPLEAASTIREYIAHFFGCEECRKHFMAKYDDCSFRRCIRLTDDEDSSDPNDWKQLALWMWEVHNEVSVRIARKSNAVGPEEVKALWPSLSLCLVCFEEDGRFDEDEVFEFLETTYWSVSLDPKTDRLLSFNMVDGGGGGGLSVLWILMFLAVALVFIMKKHIHSQSPFFKDMSGILASSSTMIRRTTGIKRRKVRSV